MTNCTATSFSMTQSAALVGCNSLCYKMSWFPSNHNVEVFSTFTISSAVSIILPPCVSASLCSAFLSCLQLHRDRTVIAPPVTARKPVGENKASVLILFSILFDVSEKKRTRNHFPHSFSTRGLFWFHCLSL